MALPGIASSSMHLIYRNLECCLICTFPYFIYNFRTLLNLNLVKIMIKTVYIYCKCDPYTANTMPCWNESINLLHKLNDHFLNAGNIRPEWFKKAWTKTRFNEFHMSVNCISNFLFICHSKNEQKQPSRGVLNKRCSENMQQIYRRTPIPKCNFNKVALQLYWNRTLAWVFSCKFAGYFRSTFRRNTSGWLLVNEFKDPTKQESVNIGQVLFFKMASILLTSKRS